jgi:argininosuccinate lyase
MQPLQQEPTNYRGFRQPGIRLTEPMLPNVGRPDSDLERPRMYAIHLFDKAHATMLTECGLIPREDGIAILRALRDMERSDADDIRFEVGGGMHSGEQYLIRKLGESVGGRIHLGRSSGDLGEVAMSIFTRDQLLKLIRTINDFRLSLVSLAKNHITTIMPGYIMGQHGQVTTFGHYLLSWVSTLERDVERLRTCYRHVNRSPAGAAMMTGSDFPIDRHRVAKLLGFSEVEKNTFDAILSRDRLLETMSALTILYSSVARWSDDLLLWSSSEFAFLEIPDRFCGTSSIMMQKRNPYPPQWAKGAAAEAAGGLMMCLMVERGPTGLVILERRYSRRAITSAFTSLLGDLDLLQQMVTATKLNAATLHDRAGEYWAQATDVAGLLVRERALAWRTAHQIVGILVRLSYERGLRPYQVTPEMLDEASTAYMGRPLHLEAHKLQEALDVTRFVERRSLYGGPAPEQVLQQVAEYIATLSADAEFVETAERTIHDGLTELERAIDHLIQSE